MVRSVYMGIYRGIGLEVEEYRSDQYNYPVTIVTNTTRTIITICTINILISTIQHTHTHTYPTYSVCFH